MKWAVRITIAVVLGAVINVGVAWGCALWSGWSLTHQWTDIDGLPPRLRSTLPDAWLMSPDPDSSERGWAKAPELTGFGVRCEQILVVQPRDRNGYSESRVINHLATGWPMKMVSCTTRLVPRDEPALRPRSLPAPAWLRPIQRGGVWTTPDASNALPLDPVWAGAVVNTAFYAALILLLWRGPALIRRTIRARVGLCPSCGYNRKGLASPSTPCPECGAAPTPAPAAEVRG